MTSCYSQNDNTWTVALCRPLRLLPVLLAVFLFVAGPAAAQELPAPEKDLNVSPEETEALDAAALASALVAYGQEHNDAAALVTAARILTHYNAHLSDAAEEDDEPVDDDGQKETLDVPFTAEGLLEAAREMDGGDAVEAMIADVENMLSDEEDGIRGATVGPRVESGRVLANDTDRWTLVPFQGGELARVVLRGDGDTDLDCYITELDGDIVDRDLNYSDTCSLSWVPSSTQRYRLVIRNLGDVWNAYRFAHN